MHDRLVQLACVAAAAAAVAVAALLNGPIESRRAELNLVTASAGQVAAKDPRTVLLQVAPGGLRAPMLTYLWIRSQQLKEEGRLFDAKQLRDLICDLMPHYPAVWTFHGWDMAWNISVMTHTPQERWMWVYNGLQLLRDKGLYYNPKNLIIYQQLAWIFFNKMGEYTDEMHKVYKRRWAAKMQQVLGAPPVTGGTSEVIDAFRPIAQAPEELAELTADKPVAEFVQKLRAEGLEPDEAFLRFYNRFSPDPLVAEFEWLRDPPADARERRIAELMSSKDLVAARAKVLAFARGKVLRETYRMDPQWMLGLMERYGPLDWRVVFPHAIYWATIGMHRSQGLALKDIHILNADRVLLFSLIALTRAGQLSYSTNPKDPEYPFIDWQGDWRFIEPTHQAYLDAEVKLTGGLDKLKDDRNMLYDGHVNYLSAAIQQLYVGGREEDAQHYYDQLRDLLKPQGEIYQKPLREFIIAKRAEAGEPMSDVARALWSGALRSAYRALAGGNVSQYQSYRAFAVRAFNALVDQAPVRIRPEDFDVQERNVLLLMLLRPEALALEVPLLSKVRLYRALPLKTQQDIYPLVAEQLRAECQQEGIDFDKAFPPPPELAPTAGSRRPAAAG